MLYAGLTRIASKALGLISPKRAVEYLRYHKMLRAYDAAAASGSHNENWLPLNQTGDQEIGRDWPTVLGRSRDLHRNHPLVTDALRIGLAFTVGTALNPQWCIKDNQGKRNEKQIDLIEYRHQKWGEDCTIDGKDWQDFKELCWRHLKMDGEVFIIFSADKTHPFKLQLIEPDQLDSFVDGDLKNGNYGIRGVEFNRAGRPVAYHFHDCHPGGNLGATESVRVSAERVRHVYAPGRVTETRGICHYVSAIMSLYDQNELSDQILLLHRIAAAYGIFIQSKHSEDELASLGLTGKAIDGTPERIKHLDPASVNYLPENYSATTVKPEMPSTGFDEFNKSYLRKSGKGFGMSYETFTGDLSNANFSSLRAGQNSERSVFRMDSSLMIRKAIGPVVNAWQDVEVAAGLLQLPGYWDNKAKYTKKRYTLPALPSTNPLQDEKADEQALENRTTTRRIICERKGLDYDEVEEELMLEESRLRPNAIDPEKEE